MALARANRPLYPHLDGGRRCWWRPWSLFGSSLSGLASGLWSFCQTRILLASPPRLGAVDTGCPWSESRKLLRNDNIYHGVKTPIYSPTKPRFLQLRAFPAAASMAGIGNPTKAMAFSPPASLLEADDVGSTLSIASILASMISPRTAFEPR